MRISIKLINTFLLIIVSTLLAPAVNASEKVWPSDLIGVWTSSNDGPDHHMSSGDILKNCAGFKFIIHSDMRVEAITLGSSGGYMFWAVAETPCLFKNETLACKMNVYTSKRVISENKPVAWSLSKIRDGVYDSTTLIGSNSSDTMYRCPETIQETSLIKARNKT